MLPKQRCYRTLSDMNFKANLNKMRLSGNPVFVCSIETTGLDKYNDSVICIEAIECHFNGKKLEKDEEHRFLIKPEKELSADAQKYSGITNEMLQDADDIETAMEKVYDLFGDTPNIIGVNIRDFCIPFLKNAGFNSGYMMSDFNYIDITSIAKAIFPLRNYKFSTICSELGLKTNNYAGSELSAKTNMKYDAFCKLFPMVPCGNELVEVKSLSYWKKSYNCRFIYIITNYGKLALNCKTMFYQESDEGMFDIIDLDSLTAALLKGSNTPSVYEFIKAYEKKNS